MKSVSRCRSSVVRISIVLGIMILAALSSPGCKSMLGKEQNARAPAKAADSAAPLQGALYYMDGGASPKMRAEQKAFPPANGGSKVPNSQAYDAMFFESHGVNPFIDTEDDHLSTFAADVDTASYTMTKSYIFDGNIPPKEAVRVEEFVNYFKYNYPAPDGSAFGISLEGAPSKFGGPNYQLLRIGIRGKDIKIANRKRAILTFVIDVSGSMAREDRLELVKKSLRLLLDQLREGDKVAIAVYGTNGHVIMEHRGIEHKEEILRAIERLQPEGSTNADEGLELGYKLADKAFQPDAINRIILCSDGVANEGETGAEGMLKKYEKYIQKGIALSTVGFGMGNYNDILMEKLADKGNGNYAYVDNIGEAKRVFVENLTGTLQVIAKDVKIQVDFNPEVVSRYRLLGYENRNIADNDFRNDKVDAGEIGSGHQVTALYEIKLQKGVTGGTAATVRIRYKDPDKKDEVVETENKIKADQFWNSFEKASPDFKLAATVAEFAEVLRKSYWAQDGNLTTVLQTAQGLSNEYRNKSDVIEFMDLVGKASKLEMAQNAQGQSAGQ